MATSVRWIGSAALAIGLALTLTGCAPNPSVDVADGTGPEGEPVSFPVLLQAQGAGNPNTASADVTLYCTTRDGTATAGADYLPLNDSYCGTIRKGGRTTTLHVQSLPDAEWESKETFDLFVRAVGPAVVLGDGRAGGQITAPRS